MEKLSFVVNPITANDSLSSFTNSINKINKPLSSFPSRPGLRPQLTTTTTTTTMSASQLKNGGHDVLSQREIEHAVSYAVTHGMLVGESKDAPMGTQLSHAPFALYPSTVDKTCFTHAIDITPALNQLIHAISKDTDYLNEVLKETAQADEFTGKLMDIMMKQQDKKDDDLNLSICRYDYFVDEGDLKYNNKKQLCMVEMNCIAASFAALGTQMSNMHRFLSSHPSATTTTTTTESATSMDRILPKNHAIQGISKGIADVHNLFLKKYNLNQQNNKKQRVVTMMVVQPGERNAYDQYALQTSLWYDHGVDMIRATLSQIHTHAHIDETTNLLHYSSPDSTSLSETKYIISIAYFRAGYTPDDYPSDKEWCARSKLQSSNAVNVPSIEVQLVGTKKIQQVLTQSGQVERFLSDSTNSSQVRKTFVQQLSLSPLENGEENALKAIQNPDNYVLKPQREGGGNNLYGEELKSALLSMSSTQRSAYILMQRIRPIVVKNVIVRRGVAYPNIPIVSELGVYGVVITQGNEFVKNYAAGTLLRSKAASQDDGGVAAGVAVLDSPKLV